MHVQDLLDILNQHDQAIARSGRQCESSSDQTDSGVAQSSDFNGKAEAIKSGLTSTRRALEDRIAALQAGSLQWSAVNKQKESLTEWIEERTEEVEELKLRPAKLHLEAASLENKNIEVR